jgi:signal transduction histidine kinase
MTSVARWISRSLIAIGVVMGSITLIVSAHTPRTSLAHPIVVGDLPIPTSCATGPAAAQASDPLTQEARSAWCDAETRAAQGSLVPLRALTASNVAGFLLALLWLVTGSLIVSRQPRNVGGWVFAAIGMAWFTASFGVFVTSWSLITDHPLPGQGLWAVLGDSPLALLLLLPLLFLLYPDGRAPARWRWLTGVFAGAIVAVVLGFTLGPGPLNNLVDSGILYANPIGISVLRSVYGPLAAVGAAIMLLAGLATVLAVRSRYRAATGETRQQMRWLVAVASLAGFLLVIGVTITIFAEPLRLPGDAPIFPALLLALALTIAIGVPAAYLVAIFRYRLWDLDIVIKKTVIFGLVVAGLAIVSVVVIALVPILLVGTSLSGWQLALFGVGVAVGTMFGPLLRLSRRLADRLVYGGRATPYEVLAEFSSRIGDTYDSDDVLARMAQVLSLGAGAASARVLLRVGDKLQEEAAFGVPDGDEYVEPVTHQGEDLGALTVTMHANDPMDPSKRQLIKDLAAQAGPVLGNVRLIEALRASRQRLVAAQDEERRKLERNIHDGVQQQLVALAVQLKLADVLVDRDPDKAHAALADLRTAANAALEDLRDLARGIYPPLLADKGLVTALEVQARKAAVPTTVEARGIGRYGPDVEAAVYFCTLEALNNTAKYATAAHATVALSQGDGHLTFAITDDGVGFDASRTAHGTGLQGMADRLDAIGGDLTVTSAPGAGTSVMGTVPV